MLRSRRVLPVLLVRGWLAFVIVAWLGGGVAIALDGDDPLRSDDPYLVGFVCGLFAAVAALVYTLLEKVCASWKIASTLYFGLVLSWCVFLFEFAIVLHEVEGAALYPYFSAASLVAGLVAWATFLRRPGRRAVATVSLLGAMIFAMYALAASQ